MKHHFHLLLLLNWILDILYCPYDATNNYQVLDMLLRLQGKNVEIC